MADIKEKIAMLLNLAGNNPSDAEAKAALLKARELMVKHKLRPEECRKVEEIKVVRELLDVTCTAMTNPWAVDLSAIIAENYCCRAYRTRKRGGKLNTIGMIGLEDDFAICKQVFMYAYESVTSYCKANIKRNPGDRPGAYRERCNAYGWGFTAGVEKAFKMQQEQHQEWGLVLVVPKPVNKVFVNMGKPSRLADIKLDKDNVAYSHLGYKDGKLFDPKHRVAAAPERIAIGGNY